MIIPREIIDILHNLNCEDVAKRFGIKVKGHMAHCFKHNDRVASLGFRQNHWKCFACDAGGDAIQLIQDYFTVSFQEACVILCEDNDISIPNVVTSHNGINKTVDLVRQRMSHSIKDEIVFDKELAQFIIDNTKLTDLGKKFLLQTRKLDSGVVTKLEIKSIESDVELRQRLIDKYDIGRLKRSKVLKENGTHLTINAPSLIIPYFDERGDLVSLQTRYIGTENPSFKVPRFKRICNSSIRLYNLGIISSLSNKDILYITEGITDCLAMLSSGYNAVAIPSATSLPMQDLAKLSNFNLHMVPDNDTAGNRSFIHLYRHMLRYGTILKKVIIPECMKDYSDFYLNGYSKTQS